MSLFKEIEQEMDEMDIKPQNNKIANINTKGKIELSINIVTSNNTTKQRYFLKCCIKIKIDTDQYYVINNPEHGQEYKIEEKASSPNCFWKTCQILAKELNQNNSSYQHNLTQTN